MGRTEAIAPLISERRRDNTFMHFFEAASRGNVVAFESTGYFWLAPTLKPQSGIVKVEKLNIELSLATQYAKKF